MWLLPLFSALSSLATRTFYRLSINGGPIPRDGPVLLVANHPNFLLDPLFVAAVAGRPVRFLAKAPLFTNPLSSWAVRGVGAIPVFRKSDDPSLMAHNRDSFRAVTDALLSGSAVGIFPEGWSHDEPAVTPLKTGAARIALGTAAELGRSFPIIPVGLVLPAKQEFRSVAHVDIGPPVEWDIASDAEMSAGVRALTQRIESALRDCTLNLERWEDAWLLDYAERIYAAELVDSADSSLRVQRLRQATHLLAESRRRGEDEASALATEVERHAALLDAYGLVPSDLHAPTTATSAAAWTVRRLWLLLPAVIAAVGLATFWVPYQLTRFIADRKPGNPNVRATYKLIGGAALFSLWIAALAVIAWIYTGWPGLIAALVVLPALAGATLLLWERFHDARLDIRRFFLLRSEKSSLVTLRSAQRELALRMRALWESSQQERAV